MKLSVICPYVNEWPQIWFMLQSIMSDLRRSLSEDEFEIILINNYCDKVHDQGFDQDKGAERLASLEASNPFLKLISFDRKLSHWNAKNAGVAASTGDVLIFVDAHVLSMHSSLGHLALCCLSQGGDGSIHLPLAYMNERPGRELIYRMRSNPEIGMAHYVFHSIDTLNAEQGVLKEVPVMSSCGMAITRQLWDDLSGWPPALGIYGGGENYINFAQSILGKKKRVLMGPPLYHFAERRGYYYEEPDWLRNRMIAVYLTGGELWLDSCCRGMELAQRASNRALRMMSEEILYDPDLEQRRRRLEDQTVIPLDEWISSWKGNELYEEVWKWQ